MTKYSSNSNPQLINSQENYHLSIQISYILACVQLQRVYLSVLIALRGSLQNVIYMIFGIFDLRHNLLYKLLPLLFFGVVFNHELANERRESTSPGTSHQIFKVVLRRIYMERITNRLWEQLPGPHSPM